MNKAMLKEAAKIKKQGKLVINGLMSSSNMEITSE